MGITKQPGYLVKHKKDNRTGRTYHNKSLINGKIPVYWEEKSKKYKDKPTLVSPENLQIIGFID